MLWSTLLKCDADACPKEAVEAWATTLRRDHPTVLFRSASACLPVPSADVGKGKGKERERADDAWGLDAASALFRSLAEQKQGDEPLTIAVVGVTNVSFPSTLIDASSVQ